MAFALVFAGLTLVIATLRGNLRFLAALFASEFQGQGSFIYWLAAVMMIGAVGYIKPLRPLSNAFLVLIMIVLILKNGSFFSRFNEAIRNIARGDLPSPSNPQTPPRT